MSAKSQPEMKKALWISSGLHIAILLMVGIGLPWFKPDIIPLPETIEIINIDIQGEPEEEEDKPAEAAPKPPEQKIRKAAPMSAEAPPDLSQEQIEIPDEDASSEQAEAVPMPDAPRPPDIKPLVKKPKPPMTKQAKPVENEQFQSLLKNLLNEDVKPPSENKEEPEEQAQPAQEAKSLGRPLNYNELSRVKLQLAGCWNVLSGASYAENLVVQLRLYMNPDRTVRKAVIVDQGRYNTDPVFRAAADSALRATNSPACEVLDLPEGKYDQWQVMNIDFDPREML